MSIKLGNININKIYLGANQMNKVYLGSTLIVDGGTSTTMNVSAKIATGSDDAESSSSGIMDISSSDIEIVAETGGTNVHQTVGLRFQNLNIPKNATINSAYIQFTVDEVETGNVTVTFWGEASDNPPTFTSTQNDILNRIKTTASKDWTPAPSVSIGDRGVNEQTSDISNIIQELVDRPTYTATDAIVILIDGDGTTLERRTFESYEANSSEAAEIFINYTN